MSLFENALHSIQIGVEDLASSDGRRVLSAVRNVQAGLVLLCKEKLRRLSPDGDALLKEKLEPVLGPDGAMTWRGTGKKTVDIQGIKERFKSLKVTFDWTAVDKVTQIRNDMEHLFYKGGSELAKEAVSNAFVAIRTLLATVLDEEPVAVLGAECWGALLQNNALFEHERKACRETLVSIKWLTEGADAAAEKFCCPECGSALVKQVDPDNEEQDDAEFLCSACGEGIELVPLMVAAVEELTSWEAYIAVTDGGEAPVADCPQCMEETYIFEQGGCALCGYSVAEGAQCAVCGERLSPHDFAEGDELCACHRHQINKDD